MLSYRQDGRPADRETAVFEARVDTYGPGEHDGKPVTEEAVEAARGVQESRQESDDEK